VDADVPKRQMVFTVSGRGEAAGPKRVREKKAG
jgi:hypothetical protein